MSYSHNAYIVFGFPVPRDYLARIGRDDRGRQVYLDEWLETEGLRPAEQVNAGQSNGGYPEYMVGVVVHRVEDYTRGQAHVRLPPTLSVGQRAEGAVREAARRLDVTDDEVGFHLVGEVA